MKKILKIFVLSASFFAFFAPLFSEEFDSDILAKPHRYFEIGVDSNIAAANNLYGIKDVFKKELVIDLEQISNDLKDSGFNAGFLNQEQVFLNLNLGSRIRFSAFAGIEASSHMNISDDLFELLGSGLRVGETKTVDVTGYADVFANVGVSFQTIVNNYGIKITPTYFVPIVYVPKSTATGRLETSSSGAIKASAESNVDIYTAVNMHDFMEDEKTLDNLSLDAAKILSNGGFDLTLELDHNWFHRFNAGLYTRIPILAGTLNYKMSTRFWASYYTEGLLDDVLNDELPSPEHGIGWEDEETGEKETIRYSEETYKAYRPFKLGVKASYSPFGDWLKIQPSLGIAVRNPYSSDERIFYPEYSLDFRISLVKRIFNFNFGTAYQSQIFQQRAGFSLNLRVLEILAQASMCGTSLMSSFDRNGYGAMVGVRIGF